MFKITIPEQKVDTFSGTSKAGKPFTMHRMTGYFHNPASDLPFPDRFTLLIDEPENAWPAGEYSFDPAKNLEVDRNGSLSLRYTLILDPLAKSGGR